MSTNKTKMTKFNEFSILLIPIVWFFCNAAVAPSLGALAQHFPAASDFQLKMVLSITSLTSVAFSVISGKLAKRFDKKNIVMIGLFIYGLGGISTAFAVTINQVLLLRLVTGVGVGLVLPLPGAIIAENFEGERRSRLLGLCTSTANVANVLTSIAVGILLVYGWQYPFYAFALSFVLVLTTLIGVPKAPPVKVAEAAVKSKGSKESLSGSIYLLGFLMVLAWMTHVVLVSNVALFWMRENLGPVSLLGVVLSLSAAASIVSGAVYPEAARIFKKYLAFVSLAAFGIGFAFLYSAQSTPSVFIGCLMEGLGFGIIVPFIFDLTSKKATDSQKDMAFGVVSGCMHLGGLLSPFIQVAYSSAGNNASVRFLFLVCAVEVAVAAVIAVFIALRVKSNAAEEKGLESDII